ncbi:hypothetical protein J7I96_00375 [Bacillus sp. ISL-78]|nr:hypothetical protein [Bacillus sp. ISL-78]MBT2627786.1 hypothetical protein [Bacillus sp. ISL-101]
MALYMVQNHLSEEDIFERGETLDFPDSVVELFEGYLGQPHDGFPKKLQRIILKGKEPVNVRSGEILEPVNFQEIKEMLYSSLKRPVTSHDVIAYALYPKVYMYYHQTVNKYGDISVLDTPTFLYGMRLGEQIEVEIEKGKTLFVKLVSIGEAKADGTRVLYFELNGQMREVLIKDENIKTTVQARLRADPGNQSHIGASMPGTVLKLLVEKGQTVSKGDHLMITEAMKMETTIQAPFDGLVKDIYVLNGEAIQSGELLIELTT